MKTRILAMAALVTLAGCTPDPSPITMQAPPQYVAPPPQYAAPAPVVVQQDNGTGNMLAAGAIGYMAGSALSNNNSSRGYDRDYDRRPQVVHRTTVIKKTIIQQPKQAYAYKPAARKVTVTKTYTSSKRR